ncbi:hypothetical protein QBC39DRAFT_63103 [Podospora conica]|nr:hypothetical protein QBC39DRAFT_63103 [Schizothecium conicum]
MYKTGSLLVKSPLSLSCRVCLRMHLTPPAAVGTCAFTLLCRGGVLQGRYRTARKIREKIMEYVPVYGWMGWTGMGDILGASVCLVLLRGRMGVMACNTARSCSDVYMIDVRVCIMKDFDAYSPLPVGLVVVLGGCDGARRCRVPQHSSLTQVQNAGQVESSHQPLSPTSMS